MALSIPSGGTLPIGAAVSGSSTSSPTIATTAINNAVIAVTRAITGTRISASVSDNSNTSGYTSLGSYLDTTDGYQYDAFLCKTNVATPTASCTATAGNASIAGTNTFAANQPIFFAGSLGAVTGISTFVVYYVSATGLSGTTFQVSATSGGTVITPTGTGSTVSMSYRLCLILTGTYGGGVTGTVGGYYVSGFVNNPAADSTLTPTWLNSPASVAFSFSPIQNGFANEIMVMIVGASSGHFISGTVSGWASPNAAQWSVINNTAMVSTPFAGNLNSSGTLGGLLVGVYDSPAAPPPLNVSIPSGARQVFVNETVWQF